MSSCHTEVEVGELLAGEPLAGVGVGVLEVEVVLAVLVELGRGNVERDLDLALVTGLLDGLREELKRLVGARDVRGEATLVTNVDSYEFNVYLSSRTLRSANICVPSIPYLAAMTFLRVW